MKRTQIYIPENIHKKAKSLAKNEDRSLSDLYREFISKGLKNKSKGGALDNISNLKIKGGPGDLSEKMDEYIYEK